MEAIRHFRLLMKIGSYLDESSFGRLLDSFIVPSLRRNLISVFVLEKYGYCGSDNLVYLSIIMLLEPICLMLMTIYIY